MSARLLRTCPVLADQPMTSLHIVHKAGTTDDSCKAFPDKGFGTCMANKARGFLAHRGNADADAEVKWQTTPRSDFFFFFKVLDVPVWRL